MHVYYYYYMYILYYKWVIYLLPKWNMPKSQCIPRCSARCRSIGTDHHLTVRVEFPASYV